MRKSKNVPPSLLGWDSWAFWIWTVDIFIRGSEQRKSSILKHIYCLLSNGEEYWLDIGQKGTGISFYIETGVFSPSVFQNDRFACAGRVGCSK